MSPALRNSPALLVGALLLSGCASLLGGNVKGSFACSAPGGSCAPSTLIDDQALSVIQNARPMTPTGSPAGTRALPQANGRIQVTGLSPVSGDAMVRSAGRSLRIVFPAFVDGAGNYHEARVVHAQGEGPGWVQLAAAGATLGDQLAGQGQAREVRAFAPVAELAPMLAKNAVTDVAMGLPSQAAVDAARAKALAPSLDAIKAEVRARLAPKAGLPAAPAPVSSPEVAPTRGVAKGKPATIKSAPAFPGKVE